MCGRTACTLEPKQFCKACSYKTTSGKYKQAEWRELPESSHQYKPSFNVSPTLTTPVLVSKKHFEPSCAADTNDKLLVPMVWGFIPKYHKGSFNSHGLTTNNCRSEHVKLSRIYSGALRHGDRCVVLCDGFYEWQKTKQGKQPYLVYLPQPEGVHIEDPTSWNESWSREKGWHGPKLLAMAGLYSEWISPEGEKVYNYTVLTMNSSSALSFIHERMPVILDTDQKIDDWLNASSVKEAMCLIQPPEKLLTHPVTSVVGNVRNNDPSNVKPIDLKSDALKSSNKFGSSKLMSSWLKRSSPKDVKTEPQEKRKLNEEEKDDDEQTKKVKTEL